MSIFPTKVRLATDGPTDAELALTAAVDMANATDHELHVGTVATGDPAYDVSDPMVVDQVRDWAQEMLEVHAKKIEEAGERSPRSTLGYRSTAEPRSSSRAPRR